jgi:hypothetical protein
MTDEPIKIVVTRERFEEVVSIEDSMNFLQVSNKEAYEYICNFVVDESGNYLSVEDARKKFKKIPRKELQPYIRKFIQAVNDSYVSPTNGAALEEQS